MSGTIAADERMSLQEKKINEYDLLKSVDSGEIGRMYRTTNLVQNVTERNVNFEEQEENYQTQNDLIAEYIERIYDLKDNWTEQELRNVGYREDQIYAIKNFDGSEKMLRQAATDVTVRIGLRDVSIGSNKTTVKVIADFNCEGIQSNWFSDVFGVLWSEPLTIASKSGTLRYVNSNGRSLYVNETPKNAGSLYGLQLIFPKYKRASPAYYIHSGTMIVNLKSNSEVQDIAALAAYGYTYFGANPSLSVTGNLSFTFSSGTENIGEDYTSY